MLYHVKWYNNFNNTIYTKCICRNSNTFPSLYLCIVAPMWRCDVSVKVLGNFLVRTSPTNFLWDLGMIGSLDFFWFEFFGFCFFFSWFWIDSFFSWFWILDLNFFSWFLVVLSPQVAHKSKNEKNVPATAMWRCRNAQYHRNVVFIVILDVSHVSRT